MKMPPITPTTTNPTANPFPDLPDALTLKNGQRVTTASEWWQRRRPEIVEDFEREVVGRIPPDVPKVTWTVTSTANSTSRCFPRHRKAARRTRGQLVVPGDHRGYPDDAGDAGECERARARDDDVRQRGISQADGRHVRQPARVEGDAGHRSAFDRTTDCRWMGLRTARPGQHSAGQRRGSHQGNYRSGQQGSAAQARRLGCAAGVGMGRFPRSRLSGDRPRPWTRSASASKGCPAMGRPRW